jgi:hypothetical protein
MKIKEILNAGAKTVKKNDSKILTGLGIAGILITIGETIYVTTKATKKVEEVKQEKIEETGNDNAELTKKEVVKATWKYYIIPAISCATSICCIVASDSVTNKRTTALAAAYKVAETTLIEYKDAVIDTIGKEKEQEVLDKLADKQLEKNPVGDNVIFVTSGENGILCYDPISGRYFRSTRETIRSAVNDINYSMYNDQYIQVNEWYYKLGLSGTELGYEMGWNVDSGLLEVTFSSKITEKGEPCLVINYNRLPKYEYDRLSY